jgi:hypothetical protein
MTYLCIDKINNIYFHWKRALNHDKDKDYVARDNETEIKQ